MRPERGFINRKAARLVEERDAREKIIQTLDLCIENLLSRAMELTRKRKYARKQLDRVVESLERLQTRLTCENKSLSRTRPTEYPPLNLPDDFAEMY